MRLLILLKDTFLLEDREAGTKKSRHIRTLGQTTLPQIPLLKERDSKKE